MIAMPKRRFSEAEYLLIERAAEYKSEFCDGEIYSMAGATRTHVLIAGNIGTLLYAQFRDRRCEAYMSDMRVKAADSAMYTYPDVVAVCGEPRFLDSRNDTLTNPQLVVEVMSPSTEDHDRGAKVRRYRQIESLTDYLLVSQDCPLIEHGTRDGLRQHVWTLREYSSLSDQIEIESLEVRLPLADVYAKVDFAEHETPPR